MKSVTIFLALAMMVAVAESTVFITGGGLALAGLLGLKAALLGGVLIGAAASRRRHYRPSRKSYSRRYVCTLTYLINEQPRLLIFEFLLPLLVYFYVVKAFFFMY